MSAELTEAERSHLWSAIEAAFLDTTAWDRASEDAIDAAVESILTARLAAVEAERELAKDWCTVAVEDRKHAEQQLADLRAAARDLIRVHVDRAGTDFHALNKIEAWDRLRALLDGGA